MANNLYIPFHPGDYLADTAHLSAAEHGAYFLLILNYWQRGEPLQADDRKLRGIARMSADEWAESREVILEFFREEGGRLHHGRIDEELERARVKSNKARESAERMLDKRRANAERTLSERSANQDQDQDREEPIGSSYSPLPAKPPRKARRSAIAEDAQPTERDREEGLRVGMSAPDLDFQWRKFRDYHRAKGSMMADWPAAWRTWCGNYQSFNAPKVVPFSQGPPRSKPSVTDAILDLLAEERARDCTG